jgi:pimeloyl-ACP methyl ester carboxylesterase
MNLITRYQQESKAQAEKLAAGSRLLDTPFGLLEYAETGKGPAVILSHGSVGGYDQGLWLAGLLGPGFHFLAPSRFGYLRTPVPADPSPSAQAGQYAELLDGLRIERTAVIGLSAGGPAALQFAMQFPERCAGLVMLSAISHRMTEIPWFFRALFFGLMRSNILPWLEFRFNPAFVYRTNGVDRALLKKIAPDAEKMRLLRELADTSMLPALRRDGIMNDWQQATQMPAYPLERIETPTLVVHAVNDPVVAVENGRISAAHIPGARLLEVDDGGHFCCVTHREVVVPEIRQFLNTVL